MTDGGTFPPVMGTAGGCWPPAGSFSWACCFFLAASACWTFFWTTAGGLLSGEESSSLEETELLDSFCCFWAITLAVALALSTSLVVPDEPEAAAKTAAFDEEAFVVATSELRRRTTFSAVVALGVLALELLLLVLGVVVSCELEESLSLLELPESLPELLSLELESDELPLLDSVLLVDFFLGGISIQEKLYNLPRKFTKLKSIETDERMKTSTKKNG